MESKGEVSVPMVRSCVGVYVSQFVVQGQGKIQGRQMSNCQSVACENAETAVWGVDPYLGGIMGN